MSYQRSPPNFDVFGLGQCCLDYLGRIERYPPADVKCEFSDLTMQGGGPVATALTALARWGWRCTLAGVVGDDDFGCRIRDGLQVEGVDTAGLIVRPGSESQFAFCVAEPGAGRRTIFWRRPTGAAPQSAEIDLVRAIRARVLHTDGMYAEASLAAARAVRRAGGRVSVDAGSMRAGMLELAGESDAFIASEAFAEQITGQADRPLEACRRLAEMGPILVGVTRGPRGYVAIADGAVIEGEAVAIESVDSTGCGDVFHAGVNHGLLAGWPAKKTLRFGAWAAAQVAKRLGGRAGIPGRAEVAKWEQRSKKGLRQ